MNTEERLAAANAALAAANAELAAIEAELATLPKPTRVKRGIRPIHHPESGLRAGIWGDSGPAPVGDRMRTDFTPVVTKELDPTDRPTRDRMPKKVSVRVYNDAEQQQGLAMTITERECDELAENLPFGWTIISRPCK